MDHEPEDNGYSITIPLLAENGIQPQQQIHGVNESNRLESSTGHYSISGSTSFYKTCFNGLNALSGVGILSVPHALSSGGWLSLILFFIIACSALYTGLLIQRCMDMDSNIKSYPDIGDRAFGKRGRAFVSILMNTELYMVATGFLILEGDNLSNLLPDVEFQIGSFTIGGRQGFVIIVSLVILPTVWWNNMSFLSYISASGVVASVLLLCAVFWSGAFDGIGFHESGSLLNWKGIPTAVSLYAFCYCAHPVFPTLYISMRNQKQFSKVLVLCFFLCTVTYALMAILGYVMFGSRVLSQVTLNLPTNKISGKVAIYTTLVNPIAKYALMVTPIVSAIEHRLIYYSSKSSFRVFIRTILVISTVTVALALPLFGNLMSLVGAFLSISASIIVPCLCFLKISGIHRRLSFQLLAIGGILLMGVSVMIVGTYTALVEIIGHFVSVAL